MVSSGGLRRGDWVDKVRASLKATHGTGGAVVSAGGFLRSVEGSKPPPLLGLWVSYLGGVTAPWPASDSTVPHGAAGITVFSHVALVGSGATILLLLRDGIHRVWFWNWG